MKGAGNDEVTCGRLFDATLPHPAHSVISKNYKEFVNVRPSLTSASSIDLIL